MAFIAPSDSTLIAFLWANQPQLYNEQGLSTAADGQNKLRDTGYSR